MKCALCRKKAQGKSKFCRYHEIAKEQLKQVYVDWNRALDSISWQSYLAQVSELKNAGKWVREVCEFELSGENYVKDRKSDQDSDD